MGLAVFASSAQSQGVEKKVLKLQVFLTKKQALELAFPGADKIERMKIWLADEEREAIGKICLQKIKDRRITYYYGVKNGQPMGYMVIDHRTGKNYPITFMVVLNTDGTVRDVEIMVYREPHGWEVRYENFMSQFFGKDAMWDYNNVNSITGATLSVNSMKASVAKATAAFKVLVLDKNK